MKGEKDGMTSPMLLGDKNQKYIGSTMTTSRALTADAKATVYCCCCCCKKERRSTFSIETPRHELKRTRSSPRGQLRLRSACTKNSTRDSPRFLVQPQEGKKVQEN